MHRLIKLLLLAFAVLLLIIGLGMAVFITTFDANQYKEPLVTLVTQQTGRDFFIEGELQLAPSLIPTVVVEDVGLGNADWGRQPIMLGVGRLEARIALLPLLRGDIFISRLILNEPVIHLETGPDGRGNWQLRKVSLDEQHHTGSDLPTLDIHEILVEQAVITYRASDAEVPEQFNLDRLSLYTDSPGEPLQIDLRAQYRDHVLHVAGETGSLQALAADQPFPITLTLDLGYLRAELDGMIEQPTRLANVAFNVSAEAGSLAELGKLTGQELPALQPVNLKSRLVIAPGDYSLSNLDAQLGTSDLHGTISLHTADERPRVAAELTANELDLRPFQPEKKDKKQKSERVFSTEKFNLVGLRAVDADIALQAGHLVTRSAKLENLNTRVTLDQGKLHIKPLTAKLADGQMNADIALNVTGDIPALNARLELRNILPGELPALKEKNLIRDGRTHVHFHGSGTGDSPAAIAASMNGRLLVETGRGQLLSRATDLAGGDLLFSAFQMINPLAEQESTSQLVCGVLNFDINAGVATADKGIALQTDKVNVLGTGIVDLGSEAIDIRARPQAREGIGVGLGTLTDAVYIGGTLANPTPVADPAGIARTAATVGGAVATGGMSLLARGLFQRAFSVSDPCAVALGQAEVDAGKAGEAAATGQDDKSTIERATDEVRGMFRGLFGR